MRMLGSDSWRMSIGGGSLLHDWALWIRAAERIDVPAGGVVPGPLDIARLPAPSVESGAPLAEGWLGWWHAVLDAARRVDCGTGWAGGDRLGPLLSPDFAGLTAWPALREVVVRRWSEAHDWHSARSKEHLPGQLPGVPNYGAIISEIERFLGRPSVPFELEVTLLPVRDNEIRPIDGARFLAPESLYGSPAWHDWLRPMLTRLVAGT